MVDFCVFSLMIRILGFFLSIIRVSTIYVNECSVDVLQSLCDGVHWRRKKEELHIISSRKKEEFME